MIEVDSFIYLSYWYGVAVLHALMEF